MKINKKAISSILVAAMLSGTVSALGAPTVTFRKDTDGKATAEITGTTGIDRLAVAQYDQLGKLINFGISDIDGTSATTIDTFDMNPLFKSKIIPFSDWNALKSDRKAYQIGTRTYANATMESGAPFQIHQGGHTIAVKDGVGNSGKGLHFKSNASDLNDSHVTLNSLLSPISDFMVYEFDLKLNDSNTHFKAYIRGVKNDASTGVGQDVFYVYPTEGATTTQAKLGNKSVTLQTNVYYTVSVAVNYKDSTAKYTLYKCDTVVDETTGTINSALGYGDGQDKPCSFRIHTASQYWSPKTVSHDFYMDNIRVYEGTQRRDDLNDIAYIVDTTGDVSIYESETNEIEKLSGTLAIHTRSNVAYNGTGKVHLEKSIYEDGNDIYVPVKELEQAWGVTVSGVATDYEGYGKLSDVASALGKNLYIDTNAKYNNGLCVLANNFTFPTGDDLQALNDFVFYMRPTRAQLESAYNQSPSKDKHPRILADADEFARVKAEYKSGENTVFMNWAESIIADADKMCSYEQGSVAYEERWGYSVTDGYITTSTEWLPLAATAMTMAYHLTDDRAYLDKLFEILEYIGDYPDWAPTHHLAPPRIALGYIIAYDWAYDEWTEDEKKFIEETVYEKFFYEVALAYQSGGSTLNNAAIATNNHNIVFNSVAAMAGMAFMEAYPAESLYLMENAIRGADIMLWHWAPNGSWYEGVGYWDLTMEYTVYLLSSMEATLGTMFGYENLEGLSEASDYTIYSQTQNGPHNYSDCTADHFTEMLYTPEMLWLSNQYGNHGWTQAVIKYLPNELKYVSDNAMGLLWYDTSIVSTDVSLPLDAVYYSDDVITMRNNWEQDDTSSFVGIHGGATNIEHSQLDGGSFIFEQDGIRWAIDPGRENYNVPNYWATTYSANASNRWRYFRSMPGAHNTLEIEPSTDYTGHDLQSYVEVNLVDTNDNGAIATADMTEVLSRHATEATRGFYYTDNRESLVIRDEIKLKSSADNTNYIVNEDFDGKTTTDVLGKDETHYEIVSGASLGLGTGDDVAKITGKNIYFNGNQWNANAGSKHVTYEFSVYTEQTWNKFQFYPTGTNRYGLQIGPDGNGTVYSMTPSWGTTSTGKTVTKNAWHEFALEYDMANGKMYIYMDKDLIYTQTGLDTNANAPADHGIYLTQGVSGTYSYINDLKCYEGAYKGAGNNTETPAEEFDIYWYLITGEDNDNKWMDFDYIDVKVDNETDSAILTHRNSGKQMKLEYVVEGGEAEISTANAEDIRKQLIADGFVFDTSSRPEKEQSETEEYKNRITLKVTGSGDVAITVKLTPVGLEGATPISDYNKPIYQWTL